MPPKLVQISDEEASEAPLVKTTKTAPISHQAGQDSMKLSKKAMTKCFQVLKMWVLDNLEILAQLLISAEESDIKDTSKSDGHGDRHTATNVMQRRNRRYPRNVYPRPKQVPVRKNTVFLSRQ